MEIETVSKYLAVFALIIAGLAMCVSIITQNIKEMKPLDKLPTAWVVWVLSTVLTAIALIVGLHFTGHEFMWYYVAAIFVLGFFVAEISKNGWGTITELWARRKPPEGLSPRE